MDIKYPPRAVTIRIVQELGKLRGRVIYVVRDSRRYGGRFRGSGIFGGGRGQGYIPKLVSKVITFMNGKKVYYHAYIKFSDDIYHQMKNYPPETLRIEIKEYQDEQGNKYGGGKRRSIEQMQRETYHLKSQVSSSVPGDVSTGPRYHVF